MSPPALRAHGRAVTRTVTRSSNGPAGLPRAVAGTALVIVGLVLTACGQVGPLYPPPQPQQEPKDSAER